MMEEGSSEEDKERWRWLRIAAITLVLSLAFLIGAVTLYNPDGSTSVAYTAPGTLNMAYTSYKALSTSAKESMFADFVVTYTRNYTDENEYQKRLGIFIENLETIDSRNELETSAYSDERDEAGFSSSSYSEGGAVHGLTIFSDLSSEEFQSMYLSGYASATDEAKASQLRVNVYSSHNNDDNKDEKKNDDENNGDDDDDDSKTHVDWTDVYTTSINDQGYCGSCWAFASVQQIESDAIRQGYSNTSQKLSAQQIVSCCTEGDCTGGNPSDAYIYVSEQGGVVKESEYPYHSYHGDTGTCKTKLTEDLQITVKSFYVLSKEEDMIDYVLSTGPLSICIDATTWNTYTGGIMRTCGTDVNHCVQAVGVDTDEKYWIIRNSWGSLWGVNGLLYLESGKNLCDVEHDVTYTRVKSVA